ncbi:choice-of-anchor L domain-containing protein, partial [uncultured Winogradskyella sp.]|uniref:choice-of-anchor L domain-containing protein n=1 Tax=uncultured Winogradskyella sp. TaxID=395353 RepID=UPI0026049FCB
MKKILFFTALMISVLGYSQDFSMQDGTFTRCEPDRFFDSGGEFGSYGDDESFTTTICAPNADEFIILDFVDFSTQLNADILTIYDGDDTTAPVIGTYSGVASPGTVIASTDNASGCLTITFTSNGSLNTTGWEANITCAVSCQTITPEIVSTTPVETFPNVVEILPGETVDFVGGATFSVDGTNATYSWTFGDGNVGAGTNVSNTYAAPGTYLVTLTVEDDNPIGCDESTTFFVNVLDPIVTINNSAYPESSYTLEELVENVLVSGGCSSVDNFEVQVSGTPGALQTKSYGYFTRGGAAPNFPFEEGIVLSTGRAFEGGNQDDGPGTTASTNLGLGGDADLEALFLPTDPSFNSNDATYVKFSFVPTDTAISFRYIMFSEEYDGSTECSFADAFAFLLREVGTTEYTNLAVLDDGTPVSVTNINNSGTCTANPAFFNGYELGDTNYGGRTIALTATAPVTPNVEYEIKLVVADEGDSIWDSAIFLEAGSFNLGGDLGDDVTIAAGTAECGGTAVTLDTQAPTATHTWYYSPTDDINNATLINGETGSTIDVTDEGYYYVDVVFAPGCENSSDIFVQFKPNPVANTAPDLSTCDADGTAEFDLSENDDDVLGSQNPDDFVITYHLTEQDAIDNVGALPTNYTNVSNPQTIWVRIADASQECFDTTSFQLLFTDIITGSMITPIQVCDGDTIDGIGTFTLTDRDAEVIGTNDPDNVSVTYHLTETDAEDDQSPLASPYNNTTPNSQVIYARLEDNNNEECYAVTSLTLEVLGNPTANAPIALEECDDDTDGFTVFTLSDR